MFFVTNSCLGEYGFMLADVLLRVEVNVRMSAMNKAVGMAMLAFLACGQVQIVMSESVQARTIEERAAEADWRYNLGIRAIRDSQYQKAVQFALMALDK